MDNKKSKVLGLAFIASALLYERGLVNTDVLCHNDMHINESVLKEEVVLKSTVDFEFTNDEHEIFNGDYIDVIFPNGIKLQASSDDHMLLMYVPEDITSASGKYVIRGASNDEIIEKLNLLIDMIIFD